MVHATIPKSSSNFCNVTASHTKPAAQITQDLMHSLRGWLKFQEADGQSWKRRETMDFRFIWLLGYTTVRQQCLTLRIGDTMHTQRKDLPQLPSALGAPEMHQTCQDLIKKQGNKSDRNDPEILPGTPVWVQHRQNATWEPATVINQCAPNSY